jgi:hypothetical protein
MAPSKEDPIKDQLLTADENSTGYLLLSPISFHTTNCLYFLRTPIQSYKLWKDASMRTFSAISHE